MVFGAVVAVLHYNTTSRALAELANFYLCAPLLSFFDDFGALTPSCLTPSTAEIYGFLHHIGD